MSNQEVIEPEKIEDKPKAVADPIAVQDGTLIASNNKELARIIQHIADGGGFPERFDTFARRMASYQMAHSLMGPRWQLALNNIAIIKGQMCIYGELPGALAEQTGEVADKRVFCIDREMKEICVKNQNLDFEPYAGVCVIQRKGRSVNEFTYTLEEATKAGQYPAKKRDGSVNPDSPWMKYTKVMLQRKAMNLAIKFTFPDAMLSTAIAEHDFDEAPDLRDVNERPEDKAAMINQKFCNPESTVVQNEH